MHFAAVFVWEDLIKKARKNATFSAISQTTHPMRGMGKIADCRLGEEGLEKIP